MLNVLIVEDNPAKTQVLVNSLSKSLGDGKDLLIVQFGTDARKALASRVFDVLILDLQFPNRPGSSPEATAGAELLKEIQGSRRLKKPGFIIGVTEFDECFSKHETLFKRHFYQLVKYADPNPGWLPQLIEKLEYIRDSKMDLASDRANHITDLGIVTALNTPELSQLLNFWDGFTEQTFPDDSTIYHVNNSRRARSKFKVIAAACPQMGMQAATATTLKMIQRFRPRVVAHIGIAAGVSDELSLGDIVVCELSFDYGSGKIMQRRRKTMFLPDPKQIFLEPSFKSRFQELVRTQAYVNDISRGWNAPRPKSELRSHIGVIASGAAVVQDETLVRQIKQSNRKVVALDMETYGVFYACTYATEPRPIPIALKSITDYADGAKSDEYHLYAAYTSAKYLYHYAIDHLVEDDTNAS